MNKKQYKKEIYPKPFISESKQTDYLNKIVDQLMSETIIEWDVFLILIFEVAGIILVIQHHISPYL